jgi:hypothetical protein
MKIAFLTEMQFSGKIPSNHENMRTEFAWMYALSADHFNINLYQSISNYDHIFVIFPKGSLYLNAIGSKIINNYNPISELLSINIIDNLKSRNKKVYYLQEGPHWLYNDYEIVDQINFYNMLACSDAIFAHNKKDIEYYEGLYPNKPIYNMPTLLIDNILDHINYQPENKVIIGGNFARWYGGFESYIVAQEFNLQIWGQTSHAMRDEEDQLINHLPRVFWIDWMKQLSSFKYAVHLMPTVAAGTFSLNCAYFGIPCIGNINVDTQRICHPELSVEVHNIKKARLLAKKLVNDKEFYKECSTVTKINYQTHYAIDKYIKTMNTILKDLAQ